MHLNGRIRRPDALGMYLDGKTIANCTMSAVSISVDMRSSVRRPEDICCMFLEYLIFVLQARFALIVIVRQTI